MAKKNRRQMKLPQVRESPLESMFEPGTTRFTSGFLDMLNQASDQMSAALGDPANWPGIMAAAREAPQKIKELKRELGVRAGRTGVNLVCGELIGGAVCDREPGHDGPCAVTEHDAIEVTARRITDV